MYSALYSQEIHHKKAITRYKLLQWYYDYKYFMLVLAVGYELFLINIYLLKACENNHIMVKINTWLLFYSFPAFLMKAFINVIQFISASEKIVETERKLKENK